MEGLTTHQEDFLQSRSPARLDEFQVTILVRTVEFIADDGVSGSGGMDSDLVHATGQGKAAQQGKALPVAGLPLKTPLDFKAGPGLLSIGMDDLLNPDGTGFDLAFAQDRPLGDEAVFLGPAPHDGVVKLAELPAFHRFAERPGGTFVFGDEDDPAGLAIETIDQRDLATASQFVDTECLQAVEEGTRIPRHGGMHEEMGRFIDEEKILVFIDNGEVGGVEAQVDKAENTRKRR